MAEREQCSKRPTTKESITRGGSSARRDSDSLGKSSSIRMRDCPPVVEGSRALRCLVRVSLSLINVANDLRESGERLLCGGCDILFGILEPDLMGGA